MNIIRGLHNLGKHNASLVTIGNFDGVHLGHQQIIKNLVAKAKSTGLQSVLISFMPTPQRFFSNQQASLSSFKEKHQLLSNLGLDEHLLIHFNQAFSKLSAKDFIQDVLLDKLDMSYCLIGDDFRFGKGRQGDIELLKTLSKSNNFNVESTQSILCGNWRISSSQIRALLERGKLQKAARLLGREFSIAGKIVHGQQKGTTIGFPTINIPIKREISPVLGVFAVQVKLANNNHYGVCNIGKRPSLKGKKTLLEVFIFDFNQTVYGQHVEVVFKHKIRDEQKFDSFDALKTQIQQDVKAVERYFDD